jgi:hypothetical protein
LQKSTFALFNDAKTSSMGAENLFLARRIMPTIGVERFGCYRSAAEIKLSPVMKGDKKFLYSTLDTNSWPLRAQLDKQLNLSPFSSRFALIYWLAFIFYSQASYPD